MWDRLKQPFDKAAKQLTTPLREAGLELKYLYSVGVLGAGAVIETAIFGSHPTGSFLLAEQITGAAFDINVGLLALGTVVSTGVGVYKGTLKRIREVD